ncbi:hypothetical protein HY950_00035, partial [Candidatus Gottesmanbacteria bacterium]|nr:hypothetical protein [Candidatus Gottesmanbacteria bacterium]
RPDRRLYRLGGTALRAGQGTGRRAASHRRYAPGASFRPAGARLGQRHISSDARSLRDIGRADQDGNYLWVKANPTFEGLRQIIYEPTQRISVGPQKPEEKKPYFAIDKVRFLDNTGGGKFGSDALEVNQNLTTIIGGKSTGKSLLLYYMAKTINRGEVDSRMLAGDLAITYDFDDSPDFNFEVLWRDGQRTLLKTVEVAGAEESKQRKILYIPQRYLNTLSESKMESREALNEFVLNVILQDADIRTKYEETEREIKAAAKTIPAAIGELFSDREDIKKTEEELKQAGDEKGVATYIKTLQGQIDDIKVKSGFADEQLKQYGTLAAREKEISTQISNLAEDRKTIVNFRADLVSKVEGVRSTANECEGYLNDPDVKVKFKAEFGVIDSFEPSVKVAVSGIVAAITEKENKLNQELNKIKATLAPLLAKVRLQKDLQDKTTAIQKEQQKLNEIAIKKNTLKAKRTALKKKTDTVVDAYKQIAAKYDALRNEFKTFENKFGDIALGVLVSFNEDAFNAGVVREYLNRRDLKKAVAEANWGDESAYKYDQQKHLATIATIFEGLLSGNISTVKNRPVRDAVEKLLVNYFYLDFRIYYKDDALDKMSPGKKGLVLLRLLINLSNEEWPILLDQPEDDLDNRSVYDDLVVFLKEKKIQRQIVVVTHNPNLVVGADAEEVGSRQPRWTGSRQR